MYVEKINEWHNNFMIFSRTSKDIYMEKLNLRAPWPDVRERMKENDITLTDQDLEYRPGSDDELLERLSGKMNKSKREIKEYIESISANDDKAG